MDKPTFHIQIGNNGWSKIDDIEDMSVADIKVHPGSDCPRSKYWERVTGQQRLQAYWECVTPNSKSSIEDFISLYVKETMDKAALRARHRMLFGDFSNDATFAGLPKLDETRIDHSLARIQQIGRGLREGSKACATWRELNANYPDLPFEERLKMHQIQFTEAEQYLAEPETKTVQYRGFTFTDVPGWVKYVTTDYLGDIYGYENKPKFLDVAAVWTNVGGGRDCRLRKALVKGAYAPENSLVEL